MLKTFGSNLKSSIIAIVFLIAMIGKLCATPPDSNGILGFIIPHPDIRFLPPVDSPAYKVSSRPHLLPRQTVLQVGMPVVHGLQTPLIFEEIPQPKMPLAETNYHLPVLTHSPATESANWSVEQKASSNSQQWLDKYNGRIENVSNKPLWQREQRNGLPSGYFPWWDSLVRQPLNQANQPLQVGVGSLANNALQYSSYVQVITTSPEIKRAELLEQRGAFDWTAYLDTTFDDISDPIGSTLTTGNAATRYKNLGLDLETGLRRKNSLGGDIEVFQQFGGERDNSQFLTPNPQRTTRLELRYTQPLLRGAGRFYNESQIVNAQIQVNLSRDEVASQLESHLGKVMKAYWELYLARAEFLQRQKLLYSAQGIQQKLIARRQVDAVRGQELRATEAVNDRNSEMVNVINRIQRLQTELRVLVGSPDLMQLYGREITPMDSPLLEPIPLSMSDSLHTALQNRSDISQAIRSVRAASIRYDVAKKDILPKLDLVTSTYVSGIADGSGLAVAYADQFDRGRPTYSVGFLFEVPLENRQAHGRANRQKWEMNRILYQYKHVVEEALSSVEISVRAVENRYQIMVDKYHAMRSTQEAASYFEARWKNPTDNNDSPSLRLEQLLDAQERVADKELEMASAQVNYALSIIQLKSEMGTLLQVESP
ncbi:MAG: outer membrane channel protein [Blastopirellula sp.]|nr:MAG: outer membrane channel protein [Blastopirellula sp.]